MRNIKNKTNQFEVEIIEGHGSHGQISCGNG